MGSAPLAQLNEPITETPTGISGLRLDNDRRATRALFTTLFVAISFLMVLDFVTRDGWAEQIPLLATRILMLAVLAYGAFGVARAKTTRAFELRLLLTTGAAVLVELALRLVRPAANMTAVWIEIVVIVACYTILPNRPAFQAIVAMTLTVGSSLILVFYNAGVPAPERAGIILTLLIANAVGLVASRERMARQGREEDAWRHERDAKLELQRAHSEIRILRGLLPVCAHCRKVRTETGTWENMERFVAEHSEAQFSHGFCPDCIAQHYPEVA